MLLLVHSTLTARRQLSFKQSLLSVQHSQGGHCFYFTHHQMSSVSYTFLSHVGHVLPEEE